MPRHKKIAWAGLALFALLGLVPAWNIPYGYTYAPIFLPPLPQAFGDRLSRPSIDWPRTLLPMGVVAVVTVAGVWLTRQDK
jgi:hypothetical protein